MDDTNDTNDTKEYFSPIEILECNESLQPDKILELKELRQSLFPYFISDLTKEIVYRFYYLGMSRKEIGEDLNITLNCVRGRLGHYKTQMRKHNRAHKSDKIIEEKKDEDLLMTILKDEIKVLKKMIRGLKEDDIAFSSILILGRFYTKRIKEIEIKILENENGNKENGEK